ncbi:hypothetical protein AVEN_233590-1 [Araneus ventricosus]|nr:hypothetical protein AVEN_233590-1 [Araneus ventricosus]
MKNCMEMCFGFIALDPFKQAPNRLWIKKYNISNAVNSVIALTLVLCVALSASMVCEASKNSKDVQEKNVQTFSWFRTSDKKQETLPSVHGSQQTTFRTFSVELRLLH